MINDFIEMGFFFKFVGWVIKLCIAFFKALYKGCVWIVRKVAELSGKKEKQGQEETAPVETLDPRTFDPYANVNNTLADVNYAEVENE